MSYFCPLSVGHSLIECVMLYILISILVCVAATLFCACLVNVQIYVSFNVIAGSMQELYAFLFRQLAMLLSKRSRCLAHAAQPSTIIRCVPLSWFFSVPDGSVLPPNGSLQFFYQHIVQIHRGVVYNHHCFLSICLYFHRL